MMRKSRELAQSIQVLDETYNNLTQSKLIPMMKSGKKAEATAYAATTLSPLGKEMLVKVAEYQKLRNEKITGPI